VTDEQAETGHDRADGDALGHAVLSASEVPLQLPGSMLPA
jgi:hypothetical protein